MGSIRENEAAHRRRVLYIDDDQDLTLLIAAVLERRGFEVVCREDIAGARDAARDGFDAVVADLRLAEGSGLTLCRELRAERPDLPILVVSGDQSARDDVEAEGFDFLLKPVGIDTLDSALRRATGLPPTA